MSILVGGGTGGNDKEILVLKDDISKLAQAVNILNANILTLSMIIEYVLEKLEVDRIELDEYLKNKFSELSKQQSKIITT